MGVLPEILDMLAIDLPIVGLEASGGEGFSSGWVTFLNSGMSRGRSSAGHPGYINYRRAISTLGVAT